MKFMLITLPATADITRRQLSALTAAPTSKVLSGKPYSVQGCNSARRTSPYMLLRSLGMLTAARRLAGITACQQMPWPVKQNKPPNASPLTLSAVAISGQADSSQAMSAMKSDTSRAHAQYTLLLTILALLIGEKDAAHANRR
jgi:hypothetical protein